LRKLELSTGHARALVSLPGKETQIATWKKIIAGGLSVRRAEELARDILNPSDIKKSPKQNLAKRRPEIELYDVYPDLESRLRETLATQVKIRSTADGKGKVEIEFYSNEELTRIIEIIESGKES
jgi:ParB family chromosome partitioning protein